MTGPVQEDPYGPHKGPYGPIRPIWAQEFTRAPRARDNRRLPSDGLIGAIFSRIMKLTIGPPFQNYAPFPLFDLISMFLKLLDTKPCGIMMA